VFGPTSKCLPWKCSTSGSIKFPQKRGSCWRTRIKNSCSCSYELMVNHWYYGKIIKIISIRSISVIVDSWRRWIVSPLHVIACCLLKPIGSEWQSGFEVVLFLPALIVWDIEVVRTLVYSSINTADCVCLGSRTHCHSLAWNYYLYLFILNGLSAKVWNQLCILVVLPV
jgi:hypothetical protein